MEVGLGPGDFVLDGDPAPPPQKGGLGGAPPTKKNLAHVYCGQTAGWMQLVLGMEVGLSPGDFVLDWDPTPFRQKGAEPPFPIFGPFLLWTNGCLHQNATWYGGRPQPRQLCVRWGTSPLPPKGGGASLPNFRPISIVAKRLHASKCHLVRS